MTLATDQQRISHLKATCTEAEKAAIDHAVTLYQALHRDLSPINPSSRGGVFAAICSEWVAATLEHLGSG